MRNELTLDDVLLGDSAIVLKINSTGSIRRRLLDMGLTIGTKVENVLESPSGGINAYLIRGAIVAIRDDDASNIIVGVL